MCYVATYVLCMYVRMYTCLKWVATYCMYSFIYVTGPAKINHVSAKKSLIFLSLLYHNL